MSSSFWFPASKSPRGEVRTPDVRFGSLAEVARSARKVCSLAWTRHSRRRHRPLYGWVRDRLAEGLAELPHTFSLAHPFIRGRELIQFEKGHCGSAKALEKRYKRPQLIPVRGSLLPYCEPNIPE